MSYLVLALCVLGANAAITSQSQERAGEESLEALRSESFPEGFQFAVATASYQIEGGWNADGKGENIWDRFTRDHPARMTDRANGNVACDSYHKYKEDVQMIKELGVSVYRFSLSWSRILPTGFNNVINKPGVDYYNNLIDELIANGIKPMVTIFHWDLPQPLQEIGGWPNAEVVKAYLDFADLAFRTFGDRVKTWITINEPKQICKMGYGDAWLAPSKSSPGFGDYMCTKNVMVAHAKAYRLYERLYKDTQQGKLGLSVDTFWFQPETDADQEAADRVFDFYTGIFTNPVFGNGDFPESVKKAVGERSAKQNFAESRLPAFTEEEMKDLKGSADFYGLNFYTSVIVVDSETTDLSVVDWDSDMGARYYWDEKWEKATSWWLRVTPWNLPNVLLNLRDKYGDIPIYITENGFSDHENKNDVTRANYYLRHLSACLQAIHDDKINLQLYTAWSLLDNFEWTHGYVNRFGLYHVDFNDANRARTAKLSAKTYAQVVKERKLPATTIAGGSAMIRSSLAFVTAICLIPYYIFSC